MINHNHHLLFFEPPVCLLTRPNNKISFKLNLITKRSTKLITDFIVDIIFCYDPPKLEQNTSRIEEMQRVCFTLPLMFPEVRT